MKNDSKEYNKLNANDQEIENPKPVLRDIRDGKKKWLIFCLILISSVRKKFKKKYQKFYLKFITKIFSNFLKIEWDLLLQRYVRYSP